MNDTQGVQHSRNTEVRSTEQFRENLDAIILARATDLTLDEQEAVQALPSGAALLVVRRGANQGARFLLNHAVTIAGRHPSVDIFLDDVTVSRRHAEFVRNGSQFIVRDLGSLNGTYLNGVRIEGDNKLIDASEVQVGKFKFTFFASRFDLPYREALRAE